MKPDTIPKPPGKDMRPNLLIILADGQFTSVPQRLSLTNKRAALQTWDIVTLDASGARSELPIWINWLAMALDSLIVRASLIL